MTPIVALLAPLGDGVALIAPQSASACSRAFRAAISSLPRDGPAASAVATALRKETMTLYDTIGRGYAALRRPDERIAAAIEAALGGADAASVVNVGAGTGSYEPRWTAAGRSVIAVEPSAVMIAQRPADAAPCVQGSAESLPLETGSVDAAMTVLSMHHWKDLERGLSEMARVARKRVVIVTWVPDAAPFWLTEEYFPEIMAYDRTIFPTTGTLTAMLERLIGPVAISPLPIPHDCTDGFLCAYWRRPERYLSAEARSAISSFSRIDAEPGLERLRADLASGRWAERHGHLLSRDVLDAGYRLVRCEVGHAPRRSLPTPQVAT